MSECLDDNLALALLDGKLPSARRTAVESHIESCPSCRELVVALAKDDSVIDSQVGVTTQASEAGRPRMKVGPYELEREVGSGAAGTVFRAHDDKGDVVALKYVTDPAWRLRFRREVATLSRLVHPGIVRYIAHGETRAGLYLAMEWLDGEDLAQRLERGPIPSAGVRALGLRLTAALAHAHSVNAVHRDLGPRNIFLPGGRLEHAKLLDFGLVRVPDALDRTGSQAVLGTPQYMAPEQVKDPRKVDARSDIFSLGVVFFEALSGVRPFTADDLFTVWNNIVGQPAPNLRRLAPGVSESFVFLVERMLAKNPMQRPQTAEEVHEALVRIDAPGDKSSTAVERPLKQPAPPDVVRTTTPMNPIGKATAPMPPPMASTPPGKGTAPMAPRPLPPPKKEEARPPAPPTRSHVILIAACVIAAAIVLAGLANVLGPRLLDRASGARPDAAGAP
ncbi:MAG: protein kinase [Labilithrix sp.]